MINSRLSPLLTGMSTPPGVPYTFTFHNDMG